MVKIIKEEAEGWPYLPQVQESADAHRKALGFLPKVVYEQRLAAGRLWILAQEGRYIGYVMFGGALPTLKITQFFVQPDLRGQGLGRLMIEELVSYAEAEGYGSIRAHVASDLDANAAWEHLGFQLQRKMSGGATTGRTINVRLRRIHPRGLQTDMFAVLDERSESALPLARGLPINRTNWYTLDINVWLDFALRREEFFDAAQSLIVLASRNMFRLRFTPEAIEEALRNSANRPRDPLLEIASTWQMSPIDSPAEIDALVEELRQLVFPGRSLSGRHAANDASDLRHLAISIHQGASGFITRERAILRHGQNIRRRYRLEILTPSDLVDDADQAIAPLAALGDGLKIQKLDHRGSELNHALDGLIERGSRLRTPDREDEGWICSFSERTTGVAYWHAMTRGDVEAYLCVVESYDLDMRQKAFDVLLGLLYAHARSASRLHRLVLRVDYGTATAFGRDLLRLGFFSTSEVDTFIRFISGDPLALDDWAHAKALVDKETGTSSEWMGAVGTGPVLHFKGDTGSHKLDRFDFETRFGLTALTIGDRCAFYVPINERFANELLPYSRRPSLFVEHDAAFRVERVYFRSPKSAGSLSRGDLLFFYVSDPISSVVGVARCTVSQVLNCGEASERFRRLAVLDPSEVGESVHCIAFDNYLPFRRAVPGGWVEQHGIKPGHNFVTIARVPGKSGYIELLAEGLGRR